VYRKNEWHFEKVKCLFKSMLFLRNTPFAILFLFMDGSRLNRRYLMQTFQSDKKKKRLVKVRRGTWASEDKIPAVTATLNREGAAKGPLHICRISGYAARPSRCFALGYAAKSRKLSVNTEKRGRNRL
jgi:hypothetical protein